MIVVLSTDEFNWEMKSKVTAITYHDPKGILEGLRCVDLVIPEVNWEKKNITDVQAHKVGTFVMRHDWERTFFIALRSIVERVFADRSIR